MIVVRVSKKSTMPARIPFKEPRTKWRNSKAKIKAYDDLVAGDIPLVVVDESQEDILRYWNLREEYKLYDPDQFKERLDSLRKTISERNERARDDLEAYQHFKARHLPSIATKKGYIQWQNSIAQALALEDIDFGLLDEMTKKELYESRVEYYANFPLDVFRDRINQEIRTAKYLYTLEKKGKNYKAS